MTYSEGPNLKKLKWIQNNIVLALHSAIFMLDSVLMFHVNHYNLIVRACKLNELI